MSDLDLSGLEHRHVVPGVSPALRWTGGLGLALLTPAVAWSLARGEGFTFQVVFFAVMALSCLIQLVLASRNAGEQVTCLEPGRVGTGTRTWTGALELDWHPWENVERVEVPGRWEDRGVRVVLRAGAERSLPGVSPESGQRLANALTSARGQADAARES